MTTRLWLRADGSASIGLGHVMRSLAIAEHARDVHLSPRFVLGGAPSTCELVEDRGFAATYVKDDSSWVEGVGTEDVVVFDGYHFDADLMRRAARRAARVGAVDDSEGGDFPVDVLLNQNPVPDLHYTLNKGGVALVGPEYALVREEFLAHRRDRGNDLPRTLLVTMGGSDVQGLTRTVIDRANERAAFDRVLVVVGPAADVPVKRLRQAVDVVRAPSDVAGTFATADAAISAAGSTTWELLAIGMPTALVQVADNQRFIGPGVARHGAAIFLGGATDLPDVLAEATVRLAEPEERRRLSTKALALVDGHGAARFLRQLTG